MKITLAANDELIVSHEVHTLSFGRIELDHNLITSSKLHPGLFDELNELFASLDQPLVDKLFNRYRITHDASLLGKNSTIEALQFDVKTNNEYLFTKLKQAGKGYVRKHKLLKVMEADYKVAMTAELCRNINEYNDLVIVPLCLKALLPTWTLLLNIIKEREGVQPKYSDAYWGIFKMLLFTLETNGFNLLIRTDKTTLETCIRYAIANNLVGKFNTKEKEISDLMQLITSTLIFEVMLPWRVSDGDIAQKMISHIKEQITGSNGLEAIFKPIIRH